ncbi:helix-turn-helix domain-containing protein [bacterium]|nr:helix-turn-helix domain-containing protein [bacterium]MDC0288504.1 helix-turn-helix domain-containing protein [Rubripirellula sp.]
MSEVIFTGTTADQLADTIVKRLIQKLETTQPCPITPVLNDREETARLLNLSTSTLDKLVRQNLVPSIQVGTKRLFDVQDVANALKAMPKAATSPRNSSAREPKSQS